MNATSTHDTKRSEDVRARINVLSEIAPRWERQVLRWSKRHGIGDRNTELLVYETLIGMWPLDDAELPSVRDRLKQYLEKAAREAKTHTSWIAPNPEYEEGLLSFADALLSDPKFCADLTRFQKPVAFYGFLNALAQVVLKATAPGAPDFYQGSELWDFSLVDPDNRRTVDFALRRKLLSKLPTLSLQGTAPDLTRSISKLSLPDGSEAFETTREGSVHDGVRLGADAGAELKALAGPDFFAAVGI